MEENQINEEVEANSELEQQPNQTEIVAKTNQGIEGAEQTVNPDTNLQEWQKDGRYGKMWKKADDVYHSYKSLEKSFNDLNPKYTGLIKILKDNGFSGDTLADELKKYSDYRNPDSAINKIYNYIKGFLDNEYTSPKVRKFFEDLELEEMRRKYPGMNAEQIAKQQEMDREIKALKEREQQRINDIEIKRDEEEIANSLRECEDFAKDYGFRLTDKVKQYLLSHCAKKNIAPKYIKAEFFNLYLGKMMEARDKKVIANQEKRQREQEQNRILGGGGSMQPFPSTEGTPKDIFTKGLFKFFGK